MDNYSIPINVYIDLSKAFDTLNHNILLSNPQYYGITGCSNDLLCSYLSGRSQFVEYNGSKSEELPIDTGVPQGSVLEPLLLYIYIYRVCQKKKDILNIHIKSDGINIFSQKFYWRESTIVVVKCQKFTFIVQLFMTWHSFKL